MTMDYMERALSLAKLALGHTSPNPAVGAVIVKQGVIVGEGYTQPPGSAHAEVVALERAREAAQGATMYVTLEPCSLHGRTPPCTKSIIDAGIAKVHIATLDPNPAVCGEGRNELEAAGIKTYLGEHEEEALEINESYVKYITRGLPFVIAKFAMSLDGKVATRTGESKWISGEESRRYVHCLRHQVDAIMVGVNTVIVDDPHLTARAGRDGGRTWKQPLRVILDTNGRIPATARLFDEPGKTMLAVAEGLEPEKENALVQAGAEVVQVSSKGGLVDLQELLKVLAEREITSVLVEGGGALFGSFFDRGLVDKLLVFIAPKIIGGKEAKGSVEGVGVAKVVQALSLDRVKVEKFGEDMLVTGYITR
jgi:diaminohydroxyphosphoribosylaminopyrimidine deaminase/5-amino-6-(5-phosphoribosylamino)uracil reductase